MRNRDRSACVLSFSGGRLKKPAGEKLIYQRCLLADLIRRAIILGEHECPLLSCFYTCMLQVYPPAPLSKGIDPSFGTTVHTYRVYEGGRLYLPSPSLLASHSRRMPPYPIPSHPILSVIFLGDLTSLLSFPLLSSPLLSSPPQILPLEESSRYAHFHSPPMNPADFEAKPMVLIVGQYSVGKTSFIRSLLKRDFPGQRVGPEPTTDR